MRFRGLLLLLYWISAHLSLLFFTAWILSYLYSVSTTYLSHFSGYHATLSGGVPNPNLDLGLRSTSLLSLLPIYLLLPIDGDFPR